MSQRLAQHLISRGLLPAKVVDDALRKLQAGTAALDTILLEAGAISEAGMLQALSDVSGMRLVNLADFEPNAEAGPMLPLKISRRLTVVPLSVDGNILHLAVGYPVPHKELREVAFLLGKELELWVALECRIKDWQTALYREPMPDRFKQLLQDLDPGRRGLTPAKGVSQPEKPAPAAAKPAPKAPPKKPELQLIEDDEGTMTESISVEMLEKIARGVIEEPVLLVKPKVKRPAPAAPVAQPPPEFHSTVVIEPKAYAAYAQPMPQKATDEYVETAVLDLTGYANFAREMLKPEAPQKKRIPGDRTPTEPEMPAIVLPPPAVKPMVTAPPLPPPPAAMPSKPSALPRITAQKSDEAWRSQEKAFPGGVLPPRNRTEEAPTPTNREVRAVERAWVMPAPSARPSIERLKTAPSAPRPPPPSQPHDITVPNLKIHDPPEALPPPRPPPPIVRDETDFSDIVAPPTSPKLPMLTAAPVERAGAALPLDPPRPSVPPAPVAPSIRPTAGIAPSQSYGSASMRGADVVQRPAASSDSMSGAAQSQLEDTQPPYGSAEARKPTGEASAYVEPPQHGSAEARRPTSEASALEQPPEMRPSHGAAPIIALEAPAAPPELAASAVDNFPTAIPSAPTFVPRLMSAAAGVVVPSGNPAEWSLAQARAALKLTVQDREKLVSVALDYGRRAFEFVGAFAVVRGAAVGWDARAEGETPIIRHVSIPLDAASVFRTVALTRGSYVGPLPPDALTQHYLALLGRSPRAVFLWPVEVKGRLVAMLYGDSGSKPVSQRKLNDFILFCQELPSAFGELIVFRKQRLGTSAAFAGEGDEHGLPPAAEYTEPHADAAFAQADADWFSGLLTLLTGPDPHERANAMTELSRTPDSSARALVRAFPGPTAWSRLPVTELPEVDELGPIPGALARLGRPAALALAPLLDADDSDTRYLALLTAGSLRYPELLDGVLRGLFDMEPDISSAARAAATAMKDVDGYPDAVRALRQELASRDPLRKSLAARALGMLHDREAIEGLIGLTASEDQLCSQSAAEALREICRANLGPNPRQWAAWYAMARGRRRVEWLCDALDSEEFELRLSAVEELSRAFGDNLGYFADGPETERGIAVDRWRSAVNARPDFEL